MSKNIDKDVLAYAALELTGSDTTDLNEPLVWIHVNHDEYSLDQIVKFLDTLGIDPQGVREVEAWLDSVLVFYTTKSGKPGKRLEVA